MRGLPSAGRFVPDGDAVQTTTPRAAAAQLGGARAFGTPRRRRKPTMFSRVRAYTVMALFTTLEAGPVTAAVEYASSADGAYNISPATQSAKS